MGERRARGLARERAPVGLAREGIPPNNLNATFTPAGRSSFPPPLPDLPFSKTTFFFTQFFTLRTCGCDQSNTLFCASFCGPSSGTKLRTRDTHNKLRVSGSVQARDAIRIRKTAQSNLMLIAEPQYEKDSGQSFGLGHTKARHASTHAWRISCPLLVALSMRKHQSASGASAAFKRRD